MGRHTRRIQLLYFREVVTSLPGLNRRTASLEPDDIPPTPFEEISTGEDRLKDFRILRHWLIGIAAWIGWFAWTVYVWFFTGTPLDDLVAAGLIWFVTFVITIIGVPAMRRIARNRIRQ